MPTRCEPPPSAGRAPLALLAVSLVLGCACATPREARVRPRGHPVVLVHGIDGSHRDLEPLAQRLAELGWRDVEAVDLLPNDGSAGIPDYAAQVQAAVERLRARTGAPKVDLVAFSMGTLASRYFLTRLGGAPLVRRFVSLSGPHHGTALGYARDNAGAAQMRPGSPLLVDLARDEGDWGGVEVVSFWTPLDLMIVPAQSSQLAGAASHTFPVLVHPLMLSDDRVLDEVVRALGDRPYRPRTRWHLPAWP